MFLRTNRRMLRCALLLLATIGCFGGKTAAAAGPCADDGGSFPKACTKEIRIFNNTSGTIWAILQGSIQLTDALNCTVANLGGGDVWLQAALGDTSKCYAVKNDYYLFINPVSGIPKGGAVAISVPWWSKRKAPTPDTYIDWWRGARVIIFDDQTALNDSYSKLKGLPQVAFTQGSPRPACSQTIANNVCQNLPIFQVTPAATIGTKTPFQLNEFTFASVSKVTDNGTKGGEFINFNQNYNVSNVDQVYLPLAVAPVRQPADIGYMGTTLSVENFRKRLAAFTGADLNPKTPIWPIYNNPTNPTTKQPTYPKAGIRVPSAQTVFSFYMNPYYFPTPPYPAKTPQILPTAPPKLIANMMTQWRNCTATSPAGCPQNKIYQSINSTFLENYKNYVATCPAAKIPAYLKPVKVNPPAPDLEALLTFVYGWVPFNVNCPNKELPTTDEPPAGSRVPIDYISVQYNYENLQLAQRQWFNPYTQLIHEDTAAGGLGANAYAFSIDDHSSFQSNSGGSLPGGLIFAVGGDRGLPNKNQVPPPTPPFYKYFDFVIGLGPPEKGGASWWKYGVCNDTADTLFPDSETGAYAFGIDPSIERIGIGNPCTITLLDSKRRKYQLQVLKAAVPPAEIWPAFKPSAGKNYDPNVVACPAGNGIVAPEKWCQFSNEVADPTLTPKYYSIGTRGPLF